MQAGHKSRCAAAEPARLGGGRVRSDPVIVWIALLALSVAASACGGGAESADPLPVEIGAAADTAPAFDAASERVRAGIVAAGGDVAALGGAQCPNEDDEPITIVYLGPEIARLGTVGLTDLSLEEPYILIDTYLRLLNSLGGIDGRCFDLSVHQWDPADAAASYERICAEVPAEAPLLVINFAGDITGIRCLTLEADIPTLGLYGSAPSDLVVSADGRLLLDDGTHSYLFENSIEVTLRADLLMADARLGLLRDAGSGADDQIAAMRALMAPGGLLTLIEKYGIDVGSVAHIPAAFSDWSTLLPEQQSGLLRSDPSPAQQAARAALPAATAELLDQIEEFYLEAAGDYRDAGIEVVVSTAPWYEMRRLMRAAELADWHPWWIASDIQGATATLNGAPAEQAARYLLVSSRRAAGDEVPAFDRNCVLVRNTSRMAPTFAHRHHTDAWSALTATCDLLDVIFAAVTRVGGAVTSESFVEAVRQTDYEAEYGGRLSFSPDDSSGADRFRVLRADPACMLDSWGCTRSLTEWLAPVAEARDAAG